MRTAAVIVVALLIGCATPRQQQISLPATYTQEGITVTVDGLFRDAYGNVVGISGIATNGTGRDLVTAMISWDVLDATGTKVSSALASTTGLKSAQRWRFQANFLNAYAVAFHSIGPGNIVTFPPR